ncbi:hypothetical protein [Pseudomonas koreensis]|uniref:Uncharacterized protein n=1 Tax=Pseudomonas koreensis TaxID=198620 RepID=A0AA94JH19_9PSED|nr:hypothetical protein [Pseudomonas koreensis]RVD76818.1 hypothetical protein A9HBioS_3358 [Pseudomonas koreensis]
MSDHSKLKQLAEAVEKAFTQLCESGGDDLAEAWHRAEEEYSVASEPSAILTLIADLERHERMLLAACVGMGAIGEALGADMDSDGEELLSMVVDMKEALEKEKALSKGWYENWKGTIVERDLLKAERDNLREDRDGLLEAGAHLL